MVQCLPFIILSSFNIFLSLESLADLLKFIIQRPDVATVAVDAAILQTNDVQLRSAAVKIVHADDLRGGKSPLKMAGKVRADEARTTCDEYALWRHYCAEAR